MYNLHVIVFKYQPADVALPSHSHHTLSSLTTQRPISIISDSLLCDASFCVRSLLLCSSTLYCRCPAKVLTISEMVSTLLNHRDPEDTNTILLYRLQNRRTKKHAATLSHRRREREI